ncbi:MAG TPA: cytochrome b N-terminal domain-containing protein [Alphaproteobacteria bacterium]|nr:cytochrome b N-terminal domain-containing protein [Alphaproteobacteria bacterium]
MGLANSNNKLIRWIEYRLPVFKWMDAQLIDYPTPRNLNYWWNFGSLAGIMLVVQIVTGIVLAMHYQPNVGMAFDSVEHIMRNVNWGWLMRYLHMNGGSMFFAVVYIHLFRGLYYGSYKAPREILWWLGVIILILMMMTAFVGYVLPWGQMSFWAATVITSLFTAIPWIGDEITIWLWGGFSVDSPTLTRFYSLHYLLPFVIVGAVFVHLWALHTHGSNNPLGIDIKRPDKDKIPFHPYYTVKDTFGMMVMFFIFAIFVFFLPNALGEVINYVPADPMVTPLHIVPEWYFLPYYAILRAIPDKLGGVVAMWASVLILFVLPWLDTSKVRSAKFRPIYKQFFWVFVADTVVLGWVGANPPEGVFILIGRLATAYYFAHFVILMPLISKLEKPRPLPAGIGEPVLKEGAGEPARAH